MAPGRRENALWKAGGKEAMVAAAFLSMDTTKDAPSCTLHATRGSSFESTLPLNNKRVDWREPSWCCAARASARSATEA